MSLVVPGRGKTTTVKPRRPRPKPAMPIGGNRPKPVLKPSGPTTKPKRPLVGRPTSSGGGTRNPKPSMPTSRPKRPLKGKVTANPYVTDNKPRPKLGSKPSGKKYEGPMRPGMRPSRPSRIKASSKRGGARPMSSPPRRPSGRR